jgi:manganese-dependent inorganic pyrophosphatase
MNYVFPYINPDTDGVSAAIAYAYLNSEFLPVIFGDFDKETLFVMKTFELELPAQVKEVSEQAKIALVDTHHLAQLPPINPINVVEVIDHHPAGDSDKLPNAKIQNEEVGAACTLITEKMIRDEIIPTEKIAGILSMAIVSNTLNFTAPSTSSRDTAALDWLGQYVHISEDVILDMFKARSDISEYSTLDLLLSSNKVFEIGDARVSIIQLELVEVDKLISRSNFREAILQVQHEKQSDYCIFSGVDIYNRQTIIVVPSEREKEIIQRSMDIEFSGDTAIVDRILLRKTDFVPSIKKYLLP